jgi:ribulose-5-phosphate 4-epimerase/fuculose-1-phosphate aldolase
VGLTRHCHRRGGIEATSGNLWLRLSDGIAITASGRDKRVPVGDIACVDA